MRDLVSGDDLARWTDESFCYVTTVGRRTGRPHVIEIWFGIRRGTLYLLSGGGLASDWVRNLVEEPRVHVRIGTDQFIGRARIVDDAEEDADARRLLAAKYQGWHEGQTMSRWAATALPVAIEPVTQARADPASLTLFEG